MAESGKQKKQRLHEALVSQILTMELEPGSDLDEVELADRFGLSRTPLREVFFQLAGDGYVELRKNRGARVSDFNTKTLRNFFLTAPLVYGAVSRLAAMNASPTQIAELKAAQNRFRKSLRSGSTADRAMSNNRYHALIGEMADNPYLTPSLNRLLIDHARISMTFYRPTNEEMTRNTALAADQHDALIEAIEARDEDSAEAITIEHWNLSRNQIELFVMPDALSVPLGLVSSG